MCTSAGNLECYYAFFDADQENIATMHLDIRSYLFYHFFNFLFQNIFHGKI